MIRVSEQPNTLSISNFKAIFLALLIVIPSLIVIQLSWYIIFLPILIVLVLIYGNRALIFFAIISFLSLTSTISIELRTIVQVCFILILFYIFIKDYGFDFSGYPEIPQLVLLLISLLFLSMVISTIFSNYVLLGVKEIFRLAIFLMIVYAFYGFLAKSKNLKPFLLALFFTGLIYFANLFYHFAQNNFSLIELNLNELLKVNESYVNVNGIGSFFIIIISLLFCYFAAFLDKRKKFLLAIFLGLFMLGLIITNSRAAILSTTISLFTLLFFYNRKIFFGLVITIIVLVPFLFIPPFSNYIDLYFRVEKLTTGRNWIWEIIFKIVKDNPILGAGPAATKFVFYKDLPFMLGSVAEKYIALHINQIEFGQAHNFYLFFLTDMGILGFLTSLFLPYVFIKLGIKTIKKFKDFHLEYYWLSLGITTAGIGLFVRGLFEWGNLISYGTLEADLPFWLIFIILIYLYQIPKTDIVTDKLKNNPIL